MTTEELLTAKEKAEDEISLVLANLARDTGLTPISVDFPLIDIGLHDARFKVAPGYVTVRLELR
jgi:hypothetical protein